MFKKWLMLAGIFLIIGFTGALLTAKSYFAQQNEIFKETKRFQSSEIQSIEVSNSVGTITFTESTGDEIIVETTRSQTSEPIKINVEQNLLSITNKADRKLSFGINFKKSSGDITVYLPKKQYERITASSNVGGIKMNQIETVHLDVESDVGDIDLHEIFTTSLRVSSKLGDVSIRDYSGKLEVENNVGDIEISSEEVTQPLIAHNDVGDINVTIHQAQKDLFISADSEVGDTRIFDKNTGSHKNGNGSITIELRTEVGDIHVKE